MSVLHQDYVDLPTNAVYNARHLRQEPDFSALNVTALHIDELHIDDIDEATFLEAKKIDHNHIQQVGDEYPHDDGPLCDFGYPQDSEDIAIPPRLLGIWFRYRIQSVIFESFMSLYENSYIDLSGLVGEVDLSAYDWEAQKIGVVLQHSFPFANEMMGSPPDWAKVTFDYSSPLIWLATMIVRSTLVDQLESIVEHLHTKGHLGTFSPDTFRAEWHEGRKLARRPEAGTLDPNIPFKDRKTQGYVAWVLPMGFEDVPSREEVYSYFNEPFEAFETFALTFFKSAGSYTSTE